MDACLLNVSPVVVEARCFSNSQVGELRPAPVRLEGDVLLSSRSPRKSYDAPYLTHEEKCRITDNIDANDDGGDGDWVVVE